MLGLFYWQILHAITLKFYGKSFNQRLGRLGLLCIMNYMKEGSKNFHMNFSEKEWVVYFKKVTNIFLVCFA